MGNELSVDELEDIQNALDAGKMITPESARRVLSQREIDKIVNAYNDLVASEGLLKELLEMAEKLNSSDGTKTDFTVKCAEVIPGIIKTLSTIR